MQGKDFWRNDKIWKRKVIKTDCKRNLRNKRINADLFGKEKLIQTIYLPLQNDPNNTRFGAFVTSIASEGLDVQQSSPTHLFVNSEYWGVYNIREKINDHYIKDNTKLNQRDLILYRAENN